jgi:hypothetical protein
MATEDIRSVTIPPTAAIDPRTGKHVTVEGTVTVKVKPAK